MERKTRLAVAKNKEKDCFNFWIEVYCNGKSFAVKTDTSVMKETEIFSEDREDTTFNISNEEAANLLESLLETGLRPKENNNQTQKGESNEYD